VSETRTYGRLGLWRDAANLSASEASRLAFDNLELRGASADERVARDAYLDLLGVRSGDVALEVGCGSGVVLRELARRVGSTGHAVGVDASASMLEIARELAVRDGLAETLDLRHGDASSLPLESDRFDVVLAATTLIHLVDGEGAIGEMVRVARRGARVGVFDRDNDSFVVSHPDRALTRRVIAAGSDQTAADSWLPRRLPGLLERSGLIAVRARGFTSLERDPDGFYGRNLRRYAEVARLSGAIDDAEHREWTDGLLAEVTAGSFLAGLTHLFVWGVKA
jgi:SAM-dependent methyltransferase